MLMIPARLAPICLSPAKNVTTGIAVAKTPIQRRTVHAVKVWGIIRSLLAVPMMTNDEPAAGSTWAVKTIGSIVMSIVRERVM